MTKSALRVWRHWLRPAVACKISGDGSASGRRKMAAHRQFRPAAGMIAGSALTVMVDDVYSGYAGLSRRIAAHAGTHGTTITSS